MRVGSPRQQCHDPVVADSQDHPSATPRWGCDRRCDRPSAVPGSRLLRPSHISAEGGIAEVAGVP